ncbi:MAG: aminoacyl-tRNA hydrolase [Clostridiales bacterium]|nr:aminoacyl-tRNA hydrolase [Clostridiales bacterium]
MLIVGLGNPTSQYQNTLHNLGFMALDALAKRLGKKINKAECQSLTAVKSIKGEKIILAKPYTYMNLSGIAVKSLMAKYKQSADDLIVIYDDIDIPKFAIRTREKGSSGTHNGMKNIIEHINTTDFKRIRIGIGQNDIDLVSYVLSKINEEDKKIYNKNLDSLAMLIEEYIKTKDFEKLLRESNVIK